MALLQFVPFSSNLEPAFWHNLTQLKLNDWKLDTDPKELHGFYSNTTSHLNSPPLLRLDFSAFSSSSRIPPFSFQAHGRIKNCNSLDEFKNEDKAAFISSSVADLWSSMVSGSVFADLSRLNGLVCLTFADLKKYDYFYWFAFPAFQGPREVRLRVEEGQEGQEALDAVFPAPVLTAIGDAIDAFEQADPGSPFFVLRIADEEQPTVKVSKLTKESLLAGGPAHSTEGPVHSSSPSRVFLCFCDPSAYEAHPGWPLRNLLTLYALHFATVRPDVDVICWRDWRRDGKRDVGKSLLLRLTVPPLLKGEGGSFPMPPVVGWEKNERGKMGPRVVNLADSLDPRRVADQAVDLNLKLMRWRLVPELDLDRIAATKVLILGSGTLGCNVARALLGWGVREMSFVDNGRVSFSNPVRQSLFNFQDCLDGGKPKAAAAADALKLIFPGVSPTAVELSIPMPGHSVPSKMESSVIADVKKLESLVDANDVVFLLMDTRESRWLPTVIANAKGKLVINAALGFDSFVVMRHGVKRPSSVDLTSDEAQAGPGSSPFIKKIPGSQLGCYFCNDVVGPGDSTKDRSLDQQCTVTRPGVSMIAAALAVELLVSLLQHPRGPNAPASTGINDDDDEEEDECGESCLGIVPHQIRGFLSRHHQVLPCSMCFDKCTACSDVVIRAFLGLETQAQYEEHLKKIASKEQNYSPEFSKEFLLKAFNQQNFLEDVTGLTQLHQETHTAEIWELSDDDDVVSVDSSKS